MITLQETCSACPEQYDALYKGEIIGYLRLRWGRFTVTYLPEDKIVYSKIFDDDWKGLFDNKDERHIELNKAKVALCKAITNDSP